MTAEIDRPDILNEKMRAKIKKFIEDNPRKVHRKMSEDELKVTVMCGVPLEELKDVDKD